MNEQVLVECAKWLYDHKDGAEWWTPYVLTTHNPDTSNPRVNIDQAYEVFLELLKRRLLGHTFAESGGTAFPAFAILDGRDAAWKSLIGKTGIWKLRILPSFKWLLSKIWLVIIFIVGTLGTFYLNHFAEQSVTPDEQQEYRIRLNDQQLDRLMQPPSDKPPERRVSPPVDSAATEGAVTPGGRLHGR